MLTRTYRYDSSRDALYRPHLAHDFFPVKIGLPDDLLCAECSLLVYKRFESFPDEEHEARSALLSAGFGEVAYFNRDGSQAFAAWSPNSRTAVVAFRGTEQEDFTDMAHNLETFSRPWPQGGKVHEGFKEYLDLIWPELDRWLQEHPGRLLFTGHSLGAALGTLAASLRKPREARHLRIATGRELRLCQHPVGVRHLTVRRLLRPRHPSASVILRPRACKTGVTPLHRPAGRDQAGRHRGFHPRGSWDGTRGVHPARSVETGHRGDP
jgi:hypothetical protein